MSRKYQFVVASESCEIHSCRADSLEEALQMFADGKTSFDADESQESHLSEVYCDGECVSLDGVELPQEISLLEKREMVHVPLFIDSECDGRYYIGVVQIDAKLIDERQTTSFNGLVTELYEEWRGLDDDSYFPDWLVENKEGFAKPVVQVSFADIDC